MMNVSSFVSAVAFMLSYASAVQMVKSVSLDDDALMEDMNLALFYIALCTSFACFVWVTMLYNAKNRMYPQRMWGLIACCIAAACLYAHFLAFQAPSAQFVIFHCVTQITLLSTKCTMSVAAAVNNAKLVDKGKDLALPEEQSTPKCVKLDIIVL